MFLKTFLKFSVFITLPLSLSSCNFHKPKYLSNSLSFDNYSDWCVFSKNIEEKTGEKYILPEDDIFDVEYTFSYSIENKERNKDVLDCNFIDFSVSATLFFGGDNLKLEAFDANPFVDGEPSWSLLCYEDISVLLITLDGHIVLQADNNIDLSKDNSEKVYLSFLRSFNYGG